MRKTLLILFFSVLGGIALLIAGLTFLFWPGAVPDTTNKTLPVISLVSAGNTPLVKIDQSTKTYVRNFLVSDIHGRFDSFKKTLKDVHFSKSDRLFVLGDTIDRGPAGMHALLYLTHTLPSEGYHVVVLTGNHEEMWLDMANKGTTDSERQSNLNGQVDLYEGMAPNGWEASRTEWNNLTANERAFLLNEMATGFGQPHLLIVKIRGKWITLSHTADFTRPLYGQTDKTLSWYNQMSDSDDVFQKSVAEKMGVPESDVQTFIGHIGGLRFGVHPYYIDLDDTNTRDFSKSPAVKIYEIETGKFYD